MIVVIMLVDVLELCVCDVGVVGLDMMVMLVVVNDDFFMIVIVLDLVKIV